MRPGTHAFLRGLVVLLLLLLLVVRATRRGEDFDGYVLVGNALLEGGDVYADVPREISTWPPFFALLAVVPAGLDRVSTVGARAVWALGIALALLAALALVVRAVRDRPLVLDPRRREGVALGAGVVVVPLVVLHVAVAGNFLHLQVGTFAFALVLGGLLLDARGRSVAGGLLVGFVAAWRVMPVAILLWFAWRRRGRAAVAGLATLLLLTVLPALFVGPERFAAWFGTWLERVRDASTWTVGHQNQSAFAMWDRWLGHGIDPLAASWPNQVPASGALAPRIATWATQGVVLVLGALLFRGPLRPGSRRALVEWSLVLLGAAVLGPVAWKHYFVVALLPVALLWAIARDEGEAHPTRLVAATTIALATACLALLPRDVVGVRTTEAAELASLPTVGILLLMAGLFVVRARLGPEPAHG